MKITKNRYLTGFAIIVAILALIRFIFPSVAEPKFVAEEIQKDSIEVEVAEVPKENIVANQTDKAEENVAVKETETKEETKIETVQQEVAESEPKLITKNSRFFNADGTPVKNRILSVPSYKEAFPDSQSVQYAAACRWGVKSVQNREEAESRKRELVYVGSNPYYFVDKMNRSIPYLVPRAAVLLNDIGRAFFDSLQMKQVPLHKVIVTSVLRTKDDVAKLRNYNHNATENSCHLYGTTFDICYNRYKTVQDPKGPKRRQVQNDTLKWVLSEVLNDMRQNKRCYVKYEVKQGCYHITVR